MWLGWVRAAGLRPDRDPGGAGGQQDADRIARANRPTRDNHGHDTCLAEDSALRRAGHDLFQQVRTEGVDLPAGIAESGHLDDRVLAQAQAGSTREGDEIEVVGEDVLAELTRRDIEAGRGQFHEQLGWEEMYLAKVGLARIRRDLGAVLHGRAGVRVAHDPEPGQQSDRRSRKLAEAVLGMAAHRGHPRDAIHGGLCTR